MDVEKNACSQSYEVVPKPKPGSTRSQPCPSSTKEQDTSQKKGSDASENGSDESGNEKIKRDRIGYLGFALRWFARNFRISFCRCVDWIGRFAYNFQFLFCWFLGALTLAIPLVLSATIFHTAHIKDVRLFGFFFWLAISWCSLLVSYIISWALGYCWFQLCQQEWQWFFSDDYETFVVDIRHSMMFFLWAITSWALVPLLCILDHRHCTDHWVAVLHKVLLVTFLCAIVFLVKSFLLERLFIKIAMETMTLRQKDLERSFYAIVVLLPIFDQPPSMKSRYEWVKAMRTWSAPQSAIENNLEQDNSDSPSPTPIPTPLPPTIPKNADVAQYVADIFQGKGSKEAYTALRLAIENASGLRERKLNNKLEKEHRQDSTTHVPRDGLYKAHVEAYLIDQLEKKKGHWDIWNDDFSLALKQFKDIDRLWPILQDSTLDNEDDTEFVSFDSLAWMILYLGECLKEAVEGQKNIKMVVNSLDVRLTLFLCIPVAIIYFAIFTKNFATNFGPLWTAFFGISFAIQDPVKEFVSACVFVFVQHPYDKGDLIILPSEQKDLKLVVTQIYLMHTSFEPVEKGKDIHIPHSKLSSDCIENWSRLAQADLSPISVVLHLDPQSTLPNLHDMWELQADVTKYVQDHPSRFYKSPELTRVPIKEEDLMESGINVEFKTKRKIPRRFYHDNKNFRNQVLSYLRSRLLEKRFSFDLPKEGKSPIMENFTLTED